jgi:Bacteriophage HK97-gp10, putative tail-component
MSVQLGPEWEAFNRRLQRTPEQMERDMRRTIQASLLLIEADARQMAPQDTRRLSGSISSRISGNFPSLVGEVGPGTRYGIVMEFGRRAGARMPPVDALIGWVRRHWHPVAARRRGVPQQTLRSQAFVLARSIQRRGIRPHPYMAPAFHRNRPRIEAAFARIGLRTVAYLAGQPIP